MQQAERIARVEHRSTKIAVISGVGTRHYYRKLGYRLEGHYMVKDLNPPLDRMDDESRRAYRRENPDDLDYEDYLESSEDEDEFAAGL